MSNNDTTGSTTWKLVVLIIILVTSIIGNLFVIIVVHRSSRNQWTTNHFVFNLAAVNLITPILYLSVTIDWAYHGHWAFGSFGCKITAFLGHFNVFVSVAVMCCMSFDRFYLTAYPLTFKLSKTQIKKLILMIWLSSAAICSPMLHFYNVQADTNCLPQSSTAWAVFMFIFCFVFLTPHLATYVMYLKVYLCILARNNKSMGLNQRFTSKVPRTKIKVTKLLVSQVIAHTLLWVPFFIYLVVSSFSSFVRNNLTAYTVTLYIVYTANAASPVIYAVFSGDFRRGCQQILVKYDASNAYRVPAHILERKNRVDILTPEFNSGSYNGRLSLGTKRESAEQTCGTIMSFEQHRQAWS